MQQTLLEAVDLMAGVAKAGYFDDRLVAEIELRAGREAEQVDAFGGDILTKIARFDVEALLADLVEQFFVHEVHLTEVRRVGIFPLEIKMLYLSA